MAKLKSPAFTTAGRSKKPRKTFDVPPDDDEPTPRLSTAPTKKAPPKDGEFDIFDIPSSPPPVSTQKKRLQERGRIAKPSANDTSVAPRALRAPRAQRREKPPQAEKMPPVESTDRRAVLPTATATGHGPEQASHTRPARRRELEHDPKQASYTRPAKRQELEHDSKRASQVQPTVEKMKTWGPDQLLEWIQKNKLIQLEGDILQKFKDDYITGKLFLSLADSLSRFSLVSNLPPGIITELANLSSTVGRKRTGKQTEDAEMPDAPRPTAPTSDINQVRGAASLWNEFYNHAKSLQNSGEDIDTEVSYPFPEDNDSKLDEACEALSNALQDASKALEVNDNAKVRQAVSNLRKAYNDAAKSNLVKIRYIHAEPPSHPHSPLRKNIKQTLLSQPWMTELIGQLRDKSFPDRLVVKGSPGIGKSVSLVGYLLFYLISQGQRVILQWGSANGRLGYVFDDNGVHEVFGKNVMAYNDGKPCYLLVSADGPVVYPLDDFGFCDRIIVVTLPNLLLKKCLRDWIKEEQAPEFIASKPSCHEVVFLLSRTQKLDRPIVYWMYREWTRDIRCCISDCRDAISHLNNGTLSLWYREKQHHLTNLIEEMLSGSQGPDEAHQIRDTKTNMTIASSLVNMERRDERTDAYKTTFATRRIAHLVAEIQRRRRWRNNWESMTLFFDNPETRVAAGELFQKMFLWKFRKQHPNTMPKCYKLHSHDGPHPESSSASAAPMPWDDLDQQPTLEWISVGTDADGSLYSKKELRNAIEAVNLEPGDPQAIRFLIPCGRNWASWDAALFIGKHRGNGVDIHIVFLQLTVNRNHDILAKGLNQVRDAIGRKPTKVRIHYHYILVLLTQDDADRLNIPTWRSVLNNSKDRKKDATWKNLMEYVMFVPRAELVEASPED